MLLLRGFFFARLFLSLGLLFCALLGRSGLSLRFTHEMIVHMVVNLIQIGGGVLGFRAVLMFLVDVIAVV